MIKYKKMSVTVLIPAHNEENTISQLIDSLLGQASSYSLLKEIIVIADACTDETVSKVKKIASSNTIVRLIQNNLQKGKLGSLNAGFELAKSEITVCLDADVGLANQSTLDELIKPFYDSNICLVSGQLLPNLPKSFWNLVANTWSNIWLSIRMELPNSVHNISGCIYAIRTCVAISFKFPDDVTADDEYIYFYCKSKNYGFKFNPNAVVEFQAPVSFSDYVSQTTRFIGTKNNIINFFGAKILEDYKVSIFLKLRKLIRGFLKNPILVSIAVLIQIYIIIKHKFIPFESKGGVWSQALTTKGVK